MNDYAFTVHFEDGTSRAFEYRDQSLYHALQRCRISLELEGAPDWTRPAVTDITRDGKPL